MTYTATSKQKLNTKSSTEAELEIIDNWQGYYGLALGHDVLRTTIHQENTSTILLAKNGKMSISQVTRQLNLKNFFVTVKIKKGEFKVVFCPKLGDFFTEPLQGTLFT